MGCASSTPIMNGEPGAGLVGTAKNAAGNVMKAGETALHGTNTIYSHKRFSSGWLKESPNYLSTPRKSKRHFCVR